MKVNGNTPGSEADYKCNSGFELEGVAWRKCQGNGQWSGEAPVCKGVSFIYLLILESTIEMPNCLYYINTCINIQLLDVVSLPSLTMDGYLSVAPKLEQRLTTLASMATSSRDIGYMFARTMVSGLNMYLTVTDIVVVAMMMTMTMIVTAKSCPIQ